MSLLEDVFLRDEADEAQELERVIEGDEYDERPRHRSDSDDDSERSNEAEEDKRKVDPTSTKTRRIIKNPRFVLNPARLTGPRGIHVIPEHFKDFKFKGKGHEREDLDLILKKLEHWAYRLYPKFQFEDCLKKIETLGKKRPVMVNLHKIRSDQFATEEPIVQKDSSDDEAPQDEFDILLQQQIDLARASETKTDEIHSPVRDNVSFALPQATSSPSINNEMKERIMRNRKLAEERRNARLAKSVTSENIPGITDNTNNNKDDRQNDDEVNILKKRNTSNIIDSSDEEIQVMNESITVDVHNGSKERQQIKDINKDISVWQQIKDKVNNDEDISLDNNNDQCKGKEDEKDENKNKINESSDDNINIGTSKVLLETSKDLNHDVMDIDVN